jgi:hypothetical protein
MQRNRVPKSGRVVTRRQRDVLCDVMLSARECRAWLTLDELAKLTHYPPASISAQLRHLRKPQYGGFALDKRPRAVGKAIRAEELGTVWEYRLSRRIRVIVHGNRNRRSSRRRMIRAMSW